MQKCLFLQNLKFLEALFCKIVLKLRTDEKKIFFCIESVTNDVKVKDLRRCKKTFERFSSAN